MLDIKITKNPNHGTMPPADKLGFGTVMSDHMFLMDYDDEQGWHDPRIVPYGNIALPAVASVFHYGAEVFEGMKAYRCADGSINVFRPWDNAERMKNSAERMGLPAVDVEDFQQAVLALVDVDRDWVPEAEGTTLYIRPFIFATDPTLSLHGVHKAIFCIITSPSGSYYKDGIKPVKIAIESEDVRAVRGGTGFAKCGGNYAAANRAEEKAMARGFSQVLWLDGVERKYVEEVGSMNVMFKIDGKVVTPKLTGSILPGVTRRSVIAMLESWGVPVEERLLTLEELGEAAESGKLEEAFGVGTAAVISPIGEMEYKDKTYVIANNEVAPLEQKLYNALTDLQWGRTEDTFGWTVKVK